MKAIKSIDGLIVPEQHILGIKKYDGETWVSLIVNEGRDIGTGGRLEPCEIKFNESPDELAAMLGWEIANEKGTDGVGARLAARLVDLTRERDEALAKLAKTKTELDRLTRHDCAGCVREKAGTRLCRLCSRSVNDCYEPADTKKEELP